MQAPAKASLPNRDFFPRKRKRPLKTLSTEFDKMTVTTKPSVNLIAHSPPLRPTKTRALKLSQRAKHNIAFDGKRRFTRPGRPRRPAAPFHPIFPVFTLSSRSRRDVGPARLGPIADWGNCQLSSAKCGNFN